MSSQGFRCSNCGAERDGEKRIERPDGTLELQVFYECGSYREMRRVGPKWSCVGEVIKCGHLVNRKAS